MNNKLIKMKKRSRSIKISDDKSTKIRNIINKQREIYDEYIKSSEMHNLVIEKVKEKLSPVSCNNVLPSDVNHFNGILRQRYSQSISLLHEASDKIKELEKEHFKILDE